MVRQAHHERQGSLPWELVPTVEHDSDRAGVDELHVHVLLEAAGTDREAGPTGEVHAVVEEALRLVRGSGRGEIRAAAAAGIGQESELTHEEEAPVYVKWSEVELVVGIGEDAQVDDLLHDVVGVLLGIAAGHADEHDQSRPDAPRLLTVDADAGPADALHEGFHAALLLASEELEEDEPESGDLDEEPDEEASRWSVT